MGLLDAIARSLAHVSDAQRSYTTFRPFEEDPTAALAEAIERRRKQRVEAFSSSPQGPSSLLDDLVLDPTVRVRYAEKAPLVEVLEEDGVTPAAANEGVFVGSSPMTASRPMTPQAHGTTMNDDDHHHRSSRYRASNFRNGQPIVDVKEMFAVTKRSNPNGLVRFVGDREGWDRCLADMAEEQHLREMLGDEYVDKQLRKERKRRRRQRERMNASLQRRVSSMMVSRDTLLEGNYQFDGEDDSEGSSENDDDDDFSEPEGNSDTNRSRGASRGGKDRRRRGGGGEAVHFDSDDDDARSVYNALERSTAYSVSSSIPTGLGRPPQAPPRRGATASGTSAPKEEGAAFKSPDGDDDADDGDALYLEKVRKLKAPRLAPRQFTHVHRCVGTDDMATIMAQSASSGKAVYEDEGGDDGEEDRIVGSSKSRTKKGRGAASAGHFSYRGGGGSGRAAGHNEAHSPVSIAGRRAKFIFITLTLGAFCFTCLLWAYVSYIRYFLSGDTRFTTGGDYWHDGFPLQTFGYNRTNGTQHIVNVTNDTSFVWVGDKLLRVKPGGLSEVFGGPDSALTMPMLGVAYIACVVAGLVFLFITAVYIVCYVNGLARGAMTADVVRMKQVSDRLRAVDKENAEHMHTLTMGAGLHSRGPASGDDLLHRDGEGGGEDEEDEGDTFGYDYEFEDGERRRAQLRSQRRRQQREEERRRSEEEARRQQQQSQLMTSMSAMMANMGMGMVIPNTLPPSWEPEIPADRRVEFNDSVDPRVEVTYGWLRPLLLYPIPLTDVLLADTSKERKKAKGLAIAIFVPAWLLAVIPTIIFLLIAGDAMDTYFISYIARSLGGIDAGVFMGLVGIVLFVLLPLYAVYHRKAGRFVERRYG